MTITRHRLITLLFIIACLGLYLSISVGPPVCFDDCLSYIALMGKNPFTGDYWQALATLFYPWSVPVFFSLFGAPTPLSMQLIVYAQTLIAFASWLAFAVAVAGMIAPPRMRAAAFAMVMLAMFGRGYLYFNQFLTSDSLALSLLLFWLAGILHYARLLRWAADAPKRRALLIGASVLLTLMVAGARETNGFIMLLTLPVLVTQKRIPKPMLALLAALIVAISLHFLFAPSERGKINMLNIITGTILPDPEKRAYFAQHGMPLDKTLLENKSIVQDWDFTTLDPTQLYVARKKVEATLGDFPEHARGVYAQYLLMHPRYIIKNIDRYQRFILDQSFGDPNAAMFWKILSPMDDLPLAWLMAMALLSFIAHLGLPIGMRTHHRLVAAGGIILCAGLANAALAFHGDFWERGEMQRHPFIGSIVFKLGCVSMMMGVVSELVTIYRSSKR